MDRTATAPIRVLIVEDEPGVRRGLTLRLATETDLDVVGAVADASDGLQQVHEVDPDLVLMDARLPGLDGFEATAMLHNARPCLPVVVLSLYDDDASRARARDVGAAAFVSKHDGDAALLRAIRQASASWGPGAARSS